MKIGLVALAIVLVIFVWINLPKVQNFKPDSQCCGAWLFEEAK